MVQRLRWNGSIQAQREADLAWNTLKAKHAHKKRGRKRKKKKKQRTAEQIEQKQRRKAYTQNGFVVYSLYIKSADWQEKRQAALERAGECCESCGTGKGLQVHHLDYSRLGDELPEDLQVLCVDCHRFEHEEEKVGVMSDLTREFRAIVG